MARTQAKILTSIWTDPDWLALTAGAKGLYQLLLSQPRLNLAGCLDVMPARWARTSPDLTEADVAAQLAELEQARYVVVVDDELVVRTYTKTDLGLGAVNSNLVKGMWSAWAGIMSPLLRKVVVDNVPEKLFDRTGVEVPEEAIRLRSEPRLELPLEPQFRPPSPEVPAGRPTAVPKTTADQGEQPKTGPQSEPRFEPQSEPSVVLLPATCCPATPTSTQDYTSTPADGSQHGAEQQQRTVDDQTIRRTANLVGRAVAHHQHGVQAPGGYAHSVTRRILDGSDGGIDLERIRRQLHAGQTPEQIADTWHGPDPLMPPTDSPSGPGPDVAGHYAAAQARTAAQLAEQHRDPLEVTADARAAARAALRGQKPTDEPGAAA